MSVATAKLTVAEYEKLAPPTDGWWELHHGELVKVTRPKFNHARIQQRLFLLLHAQAGKRFRTTIEFSFRPMPEHEVWTADVGTVPKNRWLSINPAGWLEGSPNLVIEVLSPSNTASEIYDKETLCLSTGCEEFWVIDPDKEYVRVTRLDRAPRTYFAGGLIPLDVIGGGTLAVSEIFEVDVEQEGAP